MGIVIDLELEEAVLADVDEVAASIGISRETFIMAAIKHALRHYRPRPFSAEDEANTFRLWLGDDEDLPDRFGWPDGDADDARFN